MSTTKLFVETKDISYVIADMMKSGVKYYPVRKNTVYGGMGTEIITGYQVEMDNHPIVSHLILKYALKVLNSDESTVE